MSSGARRASVGSLGGISADQHAFGVESCLGRRFARQFAQLSHCVQRLIGERVLLQDNVNLRRFAVGGNEPRSLSSGRSPRGLDAEGAVWARNTGNQRMRCQRERQRVELCERIRVKNLPARR